jgi:hypothetical protein
MVAPHGSMISNDSFYVRFRTQQNSTFTKVKQLFLIFPSTGMQAFKGRRSVPIEHRKPDGSAQAGGGRPEL